MSDPGPARVELRRTGPASMTVVLGDGTRRNALRHRDWIALADLLAGLAGGDELRCVVLRGRAGHFCSGSDLSEWAGADERGTNETFDDMERALRAVEALPVPVVAVVEGAAAGAGCQLALACDLRVLDSAAHIGMPTATLGIRPTPAFAARHTELVGAGRARELLYTGRLVPAPEAAALGLAEFCVPSSDLDGTVDRVVAAVTSAPVAVLTATKRAVAAGAVPARPVEDRPVGPRVVHEVMQRALQRYRTEAVS